MSTRELFGDSSSDEDNDEENRVIPQQHNGTLDTIGATAVPSALAPADTTTAATTGVTEQPKSDYNFGDDDDDSDKDDVEFDDGGAIVGLNTSNASKPNTQTVAPTDNSVPKRLTQDDDFNEENESSERRNVINKSGNNDSDDDNASPSSVLNWTLQEAPFDDLQKQTLHITKLPNLVGIQTQAFDVNTYNMDEEEEEFGGAVHNLMRWRYKPAMNNNDDGLERESNTRLVEWEDGSWTLHIGPEALQVESFSTKTPDNFAGTNGFLYLSQKPADKNTGNTVGTLLECLGPMDSRWTIRPTSLQSEAHKNLTLAVRQKTIKRARITEIATQQDPEQIKAERIKVKSDLDKATNAGRRGQRTSGGGGGRARPRMNRSYLEDEEEDRDYDTTNLKALKRGAFEDDVVDYEDDYATGGGYEEEEDDGVFHRVSKNRAERRNKGSVGGTGGKSSGTLHDDDDSSEEDIGGSGAGAASGGVNAGNNDDDDDDMEAFNVSKKPTTKKRVHNAMFDDDEDSD